MQRRDRSLTPGGCDGRDFRYTVRMRFLCRFSGLAACLLAGATPVAMADSVVTFGTNPHLADGARALFVRDYDSGIELTLKGLKSQIDPRKKTAALSNLCAGYVGAERYEEAIAACTEAIELRASNWRAYNNRAIAHMGKGNYAAARQDVAAGLALHPDSRQLTKVQAMIQSRDPVLLADNGLVDAN